MASAEKRVRNGRARWYARYRTPDGQQRTRTFARKVDADHFLVEIEASKQRGSFVDPRRASPTVGDWADDWLAAQADLSPTTRNRYEGIITRHIRPRWGRVRLGDVTHAQVQRWLTGIHLAPASVRRCTGCSRWCWRPPYRTAGWRSTLYPLCTTGEVIELRRDAK